MTNPEHDTPELASERARSDTVGAAACLAVASVFITAGARLDGIESVSCGVVAGITLTKSFVCAKNGFAHYRAAKVLRAANDRSTEKYDG